MKTYTITVNGKAYAVTVEEGAAAPAALQPHRLPQPPVPAPAPAPLPHRHQLLLHLQAQQAPLR